MGATQSSNVKTFIFSYQKNENSLIRTNETLNVNNNYNYTGNFMKSDGNTITITILSFRVISKTIRRNEPPLYTIDSVKVLDTDILRNNNITLENTNTILFSRTEREALTSTNLGLNNFLANYTGNLRLATKPN